MSKLSQMTQKLQLFDHFQVRENTGADIKRLFKSLFYFTVQFILKNGLFI